MKNFLLICLATCSLSAYDPNGHELQASGALQPFFPLTAAAAPAAAAASAAASQAVPQRGDFNFVFGASRSLVYSAHFVEQTEKIATTDGAQALQAGDQASAVDGGAQAITRYIITPGDREYGSDILKIYRGIDRSTVSVQQRLIQVMLLHIVSSHKQKNQLKNDLLQGKSDSKVLKYIMEGGGFPFKCIYPSDCDLMSAGKRAWMILCDSKTGISDHETQYCCHHNFFTKIGSLNPKRSYFADLQPPCNGKVTQEGASVQLGVGSVVSTLAVSGNGKRKTGVVRKRKKKGHESDEDTEDESREDIEIFKTYYNKARTLQQRMRLLSFYAFYLTVHSSKQEIILNDITFSDSESLLKIVMYEDNVILPKKYLNGHCFNSEKRKNALEQAYEVCTGLSVKYETSVLQDWVPLDKLELLDPSRKS